MSGPSVQRLRGWWRRAQTVEFKTNDLACKMPSFAADPMLAFAAFELAVAARRFRKEIEQAIRNHPENRGRRSPRG